METQRNCEFTPDGFFQSLNRPITKSFNLKFPVNSLFSAIKIAEPAIYAVFHAPEKKFPVIFPVDWEFTSVQMTPS
jgi:hypothetical protein